MTTPTDKSEVSSPKKDVVSQSLNSLDKLSGQVEHLKNFNNALAVKLDECLQQRDTLQSELTRLRNERLSLEEIDAMSPKDWADRAYERKAQQVDELQSQLTDLRAQVERLHADGAVMRGVLEKFEKLWIGLAWFDGMDECLKMRLEALSTNAGRDLLARYREAVSILKDSSTGYREYITKPELQKRRDTLLAIVRGETQ